MGGGMNMGGGTSMGGGMRYEYGWRYHGHPQLSARGGPGIGQGARHLTAAKMLSAFGRFNQWGGAHVCKLLLQGGGGGGHHSVPKGETMAWLPPPFPPWGHSWV